MIPKPTGEIRRIVLIELPPNGNPNGAVHCPDTDELLKALRDLPGFAGYEGPLINGCVAIFLEQYRRLPHNDAELLAMCVRAVHRALVATRRIGVTS